MQNKKQRRRNKFNQTLDAQAHHTTSFQAAAQNMMQNSLMGFDNNYNDSITYQSSQLGTAKASNKKKKKKRNIGTLNSSIENDPVGRDQDNYGNNSGLPAGILKLNRDSALGSYGGNDSDNDQDKDNEGQIEEEKECMSPPIIETKVKDSQTKIMILAPNTGIGQMT